MTCSIASKEVQQSNIGMDFFPASFSTRFDNDNVAL